MVRNKIIDNLIELGLSTSESFLNFHPRTRDYLDLKVLRCKESGVIILEEVRIDKEHYCINEHYQEENKNTLNLFNNSIVIETLNDSDDQRRFNTYKKLLHNKNLLDFGCGYGSFLRLCEPVVSVCMGLELEAVNRLRINKAGIKVYSHLEEIGDIKFDVITLNHVFEHLIDPVHYVNLFGKYLNEKGLVIIEVPHAKDLLIETFNLAEFKDFTFWSEHLILHTKESLEKFMTFNKKFKTIEIKGIQRYPISNHFHWLKEGKPGGHKVLKNLNNKRFHNAYESYLSLLNQTDTLVGIFEKVT